MKLLFENWRKYLKEEKRLEDLYTGMARYLEDDGTISFVPYNPEQKPNVPSLTPDQRAAWLASQAPPDEEPPADGDVPGWVMNNRWTETAVRGLLASGPEPGLGPRPDSHWALRNIDHLRPGERGEATWDPDGEWANQNERLMAKLLEKLLDIGKKLEEEPDKQFEVQVKENVDALYNIKKSSSKKEAIQTLGALVEDTYILGGVVIGPSWRASWFGKKEPGVMGPYDLDL